MNWKKAMRPVHLYKQESNLLRKLVGSLKVWLLFRWLKRRSRQRLATWQITYLGLVLKPQISGVCSRFDVVFDRYDKTDSIKYFESARRQVEESIVASIADLNTRLPKPWRKFLEKAENKSRFTAFLCEQWCITAQRHLKPE